jgi:Ribbon-helix-helix protein, copG family
LRDDIALLYSSFMQVLIDLPEEALAAIDALALRNRRSRGAEVRAAVRSYLDKAAPKTDATDIRQPDDWIRQGAGYWADREDIGDGLAYQVAIREDRVFD